MGERVEERAQAVAVCFGLGDDAADLGAVGEADFRACGVAGEVRHERAGEFLIVGREQFDERGRIAEGAAVT